MFFYIITSGLGLIGTIYVLFFCGEKHNKFLKKRFLLDSGGFLGGLANAVLLGIILLTFLGWMTSVPATMGELGRGQYNFGTSSFTDAYFSIVTLATYLLWTFVFPASAYLDWRKTKSEGAKIAIVEVYTAWILNSILGLHLLTPDNYIYRLVS